MYIILKKNKSYKHNGPKKVHSQKMNITDCLQDFIYNTKL